MGVRDLGDGLDRISGKSAILGGDNGVTPVGVNALGTDLSRVGVITLDAHLDLRTLETGPMNGNPIRGLLEDGVRGENIAQIGLQSFANSTDYALFGMQSGIAQYTVEECVSRGVPVLLQEAVRNIEDRVDAIYLDIDLDAMDAAFAPGCPGARPGGLNPADLFFAARFGGMHPKVVAMDLVELDPERDQQDRTALAAARCLLEFALGIAEAKRG